MNASIGFILLTHTKPAQILRLIDRLDRMFEQPPIVIHHDFSKTPLTTAGLPDNVSFVVPSFATGWGGLSVVEAAIAAIRQMYRSPPGPDWFVLLSGSDYPIKPASHLRRQLSASPFDAYIHHELIDPNALTRYWHHLCYKYYFQSNPGMELPFSENFRCYAGEFWFSANRRAAQYILDFHATRPALAAYYAKLPVVDESYFQCILANAPGLRLCNDPLRCIDWSANEAHPKTLGMADLPALLASAAPFARKFDIDADTAILDALDREIGIG